MLFLTLSLIALFGGLLYVYMTWTFDFWKKRGVQGPKPTAFVGSFPGLFSSKRHIIDDYDDIYRSYKDKKRFVGVYNIRTPQLLITDPKLAHDILVTHFKKFQANSLSKLVNREKDPLFSEHPFVVNGDDWKANRQMISPSLNGNRLKFYYSVILQSCEKLTKHLENAVNDQPNEGFDAKNLALMYTLDVVAAAIYGIDSETFTSKHPSEMFKVTEGLFNQNLLFLLQSTMVSMFPQLIKYVNTSFFDAKVAKYFTKVIDQSIKYKNESGVEGQDFLSFLMELDSKQPMSRVKMVAHTMTFLIDGFETTATFITNALINIARHPECQEKLLREIEENLDENGSISLDAINEMKYLDAVLHEAFRVLPPVLFYSKICTEEIELERKDGSRLLVEEGVECVIPNVSYQRDEQYFVNPDVFEPERLNEEGILRKLKNEGLLMPFGDGPRACMGQRLSTLEIKACLVELVRNFKMSPNKKTRTDNKFDSNIFIGSLDGGVWIDLERRKKDL